MKLSAQWIWLDESDRCPRHTLAVARKTFRLTDFTGATLAITADTHYRLFINGRWIEDGPCRSWPNHFQYDVIDVAHYLHAGRNTIAVAVLHYGVGTFHQIPQEAGLLAQLDVSLASGKKQVVKTDKTWRMRLDEGWRRDTARIGIQMAYAEWYDGRAGLHNWATPDYNDRDWPCAKVWHRAQSGPWKNLLPRDVRFLTREPIYPQRVLHHAVVTGAARTVTFDFKRLCYPLDRSANIVRLIGAVSTVVKTPYAQEVPVFVLHASSVKVYVRGVVVTDSVLRLQAGDNLLTITAMGENHLYDFGVGFTTDKDLTFNHPQNSAAENPWAFIGPFSANNPVTNADCSTHGTIAPEIVATIEAIGLAATAVALCATCEVQTVATATMMVADSYLPFRTRTVKRMLSGTDYNGLLSSNAEFTVIEPVADGDVELCLDLGHETIGWLEFEVDARAGTIIDAYMVEYLLRDRPQYTDGCRNGFRYSAREGRNHFVSLKRRGGRYLFITLRNQTAPVTFRLVRLLQATYPVHTQGQFLCSDASMNRIWDISVRTLRLCMEDTYTDCPLYEQTLWVGDARNESLYNHLVFNAYDITRRCLRLSAESLESLPLVISQTPSSWDIMLPAWSFLWGLNVWEYYFASGDRDGLRVFYPAVIKNLKNARRYCEKDGLFSIHAWNLFDWAGIDHNHDTVVHNSLFLIGAIEAGIKCCEALDESDGPWLCEFAAQVRSAVIPLWNNEKQSYPDSIHASGVVSPSVSQHTSALALLYNVVPDEAARAAALHNVLHPPEKMVTVGSPFALQFFLEALEMAGESASALAIVRSKWQDMLDCGATTCWETFRGWGDTAVPTRSHCHAWSAAPIYVFSRIVLGVVPVAVGAAEVVISPHPVGGISWAQGTVASVRGNLNVAWKIKDGLLDIEVSVPAEVSWRVHPNADWIDVKKLRVNGKETAL